MATNYFKPSMGAFFQRVGRRSLPRSANVYLQSWYASCLLPVNAAKTEVIRLDLEPRFISLCPLGAREQRSHATYRCCSGPRRAIDSELTAYQSHRHLLFLFRRPSQLEHRVTSDTSNHLVRLSSSADWITATHCLPVCRGYLQPTASSAECCSLLVLCL